MKRICWRRITKIVLLAVPFICVSKASAQGDLYLNPGIKIGYTFGEGGGFTFGLEVSVTTLKFLGDKSSGSGNFGSGSAGIAQAFGAVLDWDITTSGRQNIHLGVEGSIEGFGLDIGPVLVIESKKGGGFGLNFIVFFGGIIYPYFNVTFMFDGREFDELGAYLKYPVREERH